MVRKRPGSIRRNQNLRMILISLREYSSDRELRQRIGSLENWNSSCQTVGQKGACKTKYDSIGGNAAGNVGRNPLEGGGHFSDLHVSGTGTAGRTSGGFVSWNRRGKGGSDLRGRLFSSRSVYSADDKTGNPVDEAFPVYQKNSTEAGAARAGKK